MGFPVGDALFVVEPEGDKDMVDDFDTGLSNDEEEEGKYWVDGEVERRAIGDVFGEDVGVPEFLRTERKG